MEDKIKYPDAIQREIDSALEYVARIKASVYAFRLAEKAVAQIKDEGVDVYVSVDCVATVEAQVNNINDIKDMKPVLAFLSAHGAKRYGGMEKNQHLNRVQWRFSLGDTVLVLYGYFSSSAQCQFVQTGERETIEPIYGLRCEGKPIGEGK